MGGPGQRPRPPARSPHGRRRQWARSSRPRTPSVPVAPGTRWWRRGACAIRCACDNRSRKHSGRMTRTLVVWCPDWPVTAAGFSADEPVARAGRVIPNGETPAFLATFSVDVLERPDLSDLLHRLGIRTLGAFAALPPEAVLARFGTDGLRAHRLANGQDERPLAAR